MKAWWPVLVAIPVTSGGLIALWVRWRRRWLAQEAAKLNARLAEHGAALDAKRSGQVLDESLQAKAKARRELADHVRQRSALIASGSSSASVLKMARKA